jgi:hypothetical protein
MRQLNPNFAARLRHGLGGQSELEELAHAHERAKGWEVFVIKFAVGES